MFLCLDDYIGNQHHQEHQRADQHPACLPEDAGLRPSHEINVFTKTVRGRQEQINNLTALRLKTLYAFHETTQ